MRRGFTFGIAAGAGVTPVPNAAMRAVLRGPFARLIGGAYPRFGKPIFPDAA